MLLYVLPIKPAPWASPMNATFHLLLHGNGIIQQAAILRPFTSAIYIAIVLENKWSFLTSPSCCYTLFNHKGKKLLFLFYFIIFISSFHFLLHQEGSLWTKDKEEENSLNFIHSLLLLIMSACIKQKRRLPLKGNPCTRFFDWSDN